MRKLLKRRKRFSWGWFFTYALMLLLVCFTSLPLVYLCVTAFKPLDELFLYPPRFMVKNPTLNNFFDLFTTMDSTVVPFTRYIFNSVFTTLATVLSAVFICSMGAYAIEKLSLPGGKIIFNIVVYALMFSAPAAQIPIFIAVSRMGMIDTYWSLIIPNLAVPMYFFLFKQFISDIPQPLMESAVIDGAGPFARYFYVVLPLIKPAVATVSVFAFISNWNNSGGAMVYITSQAMKTLPYAVASISDGSIARAGAGAAAVFLTTLPTVLYYLIQQKKVISTMAYAGIKG